MLRNLLKVNKGFYQIAIEMTAQQYDTAGI